MSTVSRAFVTEKPNGAIQLDVDCGDNGSLSMETTGNLDIEEPEIREEIAKVIREEMEIDCEPSQVEMIRIDD